MKSWVNAIEPRVKWKSNKLWYCKIISFCEYISFKCSQIFDVCSNVKISKLNNCSLKMNDLLIFWVNSKNVVLERKVL